MARTFLALLAGFTVLLVAAMPYSTLAQDILFPLIGRCPDAIGAFTMFFSLTDIPGLERAFAAYDCLLGIVLWLAIPGALRLGIAVFRRVR